MLYQYPCGSGHEFADESPASDARNSQRWEGAQKRILALPPSKTHWGLKFKTLPLLVVGGVFSPTTTLVQMIFRSVPLHSPSSGDHQKISFSLVCPPFRACPDDAGDAKAADGIGVIPVISARCVLFFLLRTCTLCHPCGRLHVRSRVCVFLLPSKMVG